MSEQRRVYGKRALLNLPGHHGAAAIVAEVREMADGVWTAIVLISDCNRSITLEFDPTATPENDLHKVDTLIDCLRAFRRGLVTVHQTTPAKRPRQ